VGIIYRVSGGFFIVGVYKVFRYEKSRDLIPWVKNVPRALAQTISVAEILGALVLILPVITGIYSWLMPVAAVSLTLLMLIAALFHALRRETTEAGLNVLLLWFSGTCRGEVDLWGCFSGFAQKTPPHLPPVTAIPSDPLLFMLALLAYIRWPLMP
jgi:hypothetical protein